MLEKGKNSWILEVPGEPEAYLVLVLLKKSNKIPWIIPD
jgi:hypothetical protein